MGSSLREGLKRKRPLILHTAGSATLSLHIECLIIQHLAKIDVDAFMMPVGKYVFRDGGKIVKQLDADEMLEYVGGKGGTDVWDMKEGGGIINGREYSQHAMERMAPDTPSVRAELSRRAEALAESKRLQVGTQEYYQFCQKYVDPRNIPPSVIEDAIRNTTAVPGHSRDICSSNSGLLLL